MRDLVHDLLKLTSYNRGGVIGALLMGIAVVIPSCAEFDGRRASSQTGELLTADELKSEFVRESKSAESELQDARTVFIQARDRFEAATAKVESLPAQYEADIQAANEEIQNRNALVGDFGARVLEMATNGSNPAGWLSLGLTALTGGLAYDNRRKDKKIKESKESEAA